MSKIKSNIYLFNVYNKGYYYCYSKDITNTPFSFFKYDGLKKFIEFHTDKEASFDYKIVLSDSYVFFPSY